MLELYREISGNPLEPSRQIEKSRIVILHNVSNSGNWDTPIAKPISDKDDAPENAFKKWSLDGYYEDRSGDQIPFALGSIQFTQCKAIPGSTVCSIIGYQSPSEDGPRSSIRYHALAKGLTEMYVRLAESVAQGAKVEVMVGQQFAAGGSWNWVAVLLKELAQESGVPTTVYKPA